MLSNPRRVGFIMNWGGQIPATDGTVRYLFPYASETTAPTARAFTTHFLTPMDLVAYQMYCITQTLTANMVFTLYQGGAATGMTATILAGQTNVLLRLETELSALQRLDLHVDPGSEAAARNICVAIEAWG